MPRKSTIIFMLAVFLSAMGVSRAFTVDKYRREKETFSKILGEVTNNYVTEVETKKLFEGAYRGMLQTLDPYSQYFNEEESRTFAADTEGEFGGVGIEISMRDGLLTVIAPMRGTPAYDAGVLPGDIILKIDGKSTERITSDEAVRTLRGKVGTKVAITVRHQGAQTDTVITITRAVIKPASVEAETLDANAGIGYLRVSSFTQKVMGDMRGAMKQLQEQKFKALILDLRQNPGGLLDQAVLMSDLFLADGTIVSVKGRHAEMSRSYRAHHGDMLETTPLVVLVDGGSASASEIVAAALKDNHRALLVGERTYGKGSVQNVIPLGDGQSLKLTTAKYYTPLDKPIEDHQGIMPDIYVPMSRDMLVALRTQEREDKLRGSYKISSSIEEDAAPAQPSDQAAGEEEDDGVKVTPERRNRAVDYQLKAAVNIIKWEMNGGISQAAAPVEAAAVPAPAAAQ